MTFSLVMTGLFSLGFFAFKPSPVSTKLDLKQSTIAWTGYKVTGKHNGKVNLKSGELKFDGTKLIGGSFEIDMTSITTTDMSGEYATKLDNHLKSDDFFGTTNHPVAKFVITTAVSQGQDLYKISGDLTIKGIKKPIRFNASIKDENNQKTATAAIKIDRSDFDVKYGSGSFFDNLGDKTIYDEFDLDVKLVTSK